MTLATLAVIFAAGFVIMTPIGPVSTICIRRSLIYGRRAGMIAGAGDAAAIAVYATIGVTGSMFVPHAFTRFSPFWHIVISFVLIVVATMIWRTRPALPKMASQSHASLAAGFAAALVIALANPADIVLFAALFSGLGIAVTTPLEHVVFFATIFAGGCGYWVAMACFLDRWRAGLTTARMMWLNRTCSAFMFTGAAASLASLAKSAG